MFISQRDQESLKELFNKVYMDYVYPLHHSASLPPYKLTDKTVEEVIVNCSLLIYYYNVSNCYIFCAENCYSVSSIYIIGSRKGGPACGPSPFQGSHSSWKTWKNDNSFPSPGKVLEFYNFIKNPGKMGLNLEK